MKAGGRSVPQVAKELLYAYDPDMLAELEQKVKSENRGMSPHVIEQKIKEKHDAILRNAARVFTGELNGYIENVRRVHEQVIDHINPDKLINVGWDEENKKTAEGVISDFTTWLEENRDEITALQIFFDQPYRLRELTYAMIKELNDKLKADKPALAPLHVWHAYEVLEKTGGSPRNELVALVSLIRKVCRMDNELTPYDKTVDRNFQAWIMNRHKGNAPKFNDEQMEWLRMIRDHIAGSFHLGREDLDYAPFDAKGGVGKLWQLFGGDTEKLIEELNKVLVA